MSPILNLLGERAERVILEEKFENWPPSGWTINNNGGNCQWVSTADTQMPNYAGGSGEAAAADSFSCGYAVPKGAMDTELITPLFDLSMADSATLTYVTAYNDWGGHDDFADVSISLDGGTTWTSLLLWQEDDHDPDGPGENVTIDLTPYSGSIMTLLRFHYYATASDLWWVIDDVTIKRK